MSRFGPVKPGWKRVGRVFSWRRLAMLGGLMGALNVCHAQDAVPARQTATAGAKKSSVQKSSAKTENAIRRLKPEEMAGLPAEFVEKLNARGCGIPQFNGGTGVGNGASDSASAGTDSAAGSGVLPSNVIHGEFARHGQEDWAALCSNGKTSTIMIYWGKDTACPASLARLDDAHYLKAGGDKVPRYWRSIQARGENDLSERAGMAGLKPLSHQGIDDRFVGKSSAFFYCHQGKWKIFPAKDSSSE